MRYSSWTAPYYPLVAKPPDIIYGKYLGLHLDPFGKILEIEHNASFPFPSMIRELSTAGNVTFFFDLAPYGALKDIPEFNVKTLERRDTEETATFVTFPNKQEFRRDELPEAFYTTLPTVLLSVRRSGAERYYGIVRPVATLPEIYLERSNGIIYLDEKEHLIGFNETFFRFFKARFRTPHAMLEVPAADLLDPTPQEFLREKLKVFHPPVTQAVPMAPLERFYRNPAEELMLIPLAERLDTRRDFSFEVECRVSEGLPPLLLIVSKLPSRDFSDSDGYLAGPDARGTFFFLKRRGIVQAVGEKVGVRDHWRLALHRSGPLLVLQEGDRVLLAFFDSNMLGAERGQALLGLRPGSACQIIRGRAGVAPDRGPGLFDPPPVVKLKAPEQHYFILNRLNQVSLSSSFPASSAFVLENITEIQKQMNALERKFQELKTEGEPEADGFVGKSAIVQSIKKKAALVAASDITVLIQGHTGTGKEVLARFIHEHSPRKAGPLIKVDCSTIPRALMESELFGHEKGAFTGAVDRKIGDRDIEIR